ncbi:MAG: 4Fe-4S ferredoxin [Anaerolineae bacterium SM23_84]|nr:MAG: 4Fe-4S ferredoxin [Anaerolineae bacterium SM23_84]
MSEENLIPIYIMGKRYMVPPSLTIMTAMEYAGYKLIRGVGCREGFCGACATVYRLPGDYRLQIGLACQTMVQPGMYLAQVPFFPAQRAVYDITELEPNLASIVRLYPEVMRCLSCGTCTKVCPQGLDPRDFMADIMRGDIAAAAQKSFDCIMCGLCAARCPAEEAQYNVAILCRRLYGRYIAPKAQHLAERAKEIEEGRFDAELAELKRTSTEELKKLYAERDIEPK